MSARVTFMTWAVAAVACWWASAPVGIGERAEEGSEHATPSHPRHVSPAIPRASQCTPASVISDANADVEPCARFAGAHCTPPCVASMDLPMYPQEGLCTVSLAWMLRRAQSSAATVTKTPCVRDDDSVNGPPASYARHGRPSSQGVRI